MPSHKRKVQRKVKKTMKRNVDKAKAKQQNNKPNDDKELLLKLMAMMRGSHGNQSMDPATFLKLKEEQVAKDKEDARLIRDAKTTEANAKRDIKNAKGEFKVKQAQADAETASAQREHTIKQLDAKRTEEGLTNEEKVKQQRITELKHQQAMNRVTGNMDATGVKINDLDRQIKMLESSIDIVQSSDEVKALILTLHERQERIRKNWNEIYDGLSKHALTKDEADKLKALVDDMTKQEPELIETIARIKWENDQLQNTIKTDNELRDKYLSDVKEMDDLRNKQKALRAEADNAGYIYNLDSNGNPIEVFDKSLLRTLVKPEDNKDVIKHNNTMKIINDYMNKGSRSKSNTTWDDLMMINFEGYEPYLEDCRKAYNALRDSRKLKIDGKILNTFDDVITAYQNAYNARDEIKRRYDEDVEYNKKIESLPQPMRLKIIDEMVYNKESEKRELKRQVQARESEIADIHKREDGLKKLESDIVKLRTKLSNMPESSNKEELINKLVEAENIHDQLLRDLEIKHKEQRRVHKLEDKVANLQHENRVMHEQLNESPRSKQARQDAEDEAIRSQIRQEREIELNNQRGLTRHAERERRMAQSKENLMHSDEIKETEQKIEDEIVNRMKTEQETERLDKLTNLEKQTRDAQVTLSMKRRLNEHKQESTGIDDALTQLVVIKDQAIRDGNHYDEIKAKVRKYGEDFRTNPYEFERFNQWAVDEGKCNTFDSVDELIAQTETDEHIGVIDEFFDKWNGGYFEPHPEEEQD